MTTRQFDLNINEILEHWKIHHAIREIIANAIDEQILTQTEDIKIYKEDNKWIIRDFGRGLKYEHLVLNENVEKLNNKYVTGKFGIGLKDSMAVLNRHLIDFEIKSTHHIIKITKSNKKDFSDIITLHANIIEQNDKTFKGTEFSFTNLKDNDMREAKKNFLRYLFLIKLDETKYGEIYYNDGVIATIFLNGVKIAEEPNFLYSYNITKVPNSLRNALNRERINVGRTVYAKRIESILLTSTNKHVMNRLATELQMKDTDKSHDEIKWKEILIHAIRIKNADGRTVFITKGDMENDFVTIDNIKREGFEIILIPYDLKKFLEKINDINNKTINDLKNFIKVSEDNHVFNFVDYSQLNIDEKNIYDAGIMLLQLVPQMNNKNYEIKISETLKCGIDGLCDFNKKLIIIKRSVLKSMDRYLGVLVHEFIHANSCYNDLTISFENALTNMIGLLSRIIIHNEKKIYS